MTLKWRPDAYLRQCRGEATVALLAAAQFYCILTCLMVLRPAREALGLEGGIEAVRWLFMGTLFATLLVHPIFAWLVSRTSRRVFLPLTYRFFAASLIGFWLTIELWPEAVGTVTGRMFYVWLSVFNLAAVGLFWALLADGLQLQQSKRLFGIIAVGGTLGAITGSAVSAFFALTLGTAALLLIGAALLEVSIWFGRAISRRMDRLHKQDAAGAPTADPPGPQADPPHMEAAAAIPRDPAEWGEAVRPTSPPSMRIIGGSALDGFRKVAGSPYLLSICAYIVMISITATFLYFTQLRLVDALGGTRDENTRIFAHIDLWTQIATLLMQALLAGWLMRRLGVGIALALLPILTTVGFVWLAAAPALAVLVVVQAMFRAVNRAIARPARETLFTVVSRDEKYKAKSLIDTFIYRGGDVIGAQAERPLHALAPGLMGMAVAIVPIAIAWTSISVYLGVRQHALAKAQISETEPAAAG